MSNTGCWQSWISATTTPSGSATGTHQVYLTFTGAGGDLVNINHFTFQPNAYSVRQAESFSSQSGTQTQTTTDTGGGQNVGYISDGD